LSAANQEGSGKQIAANGFQQVYFFRLLRRKNKLFMLFGLPETSFVFPFPFLTAILQLILQE